MLKYTEKYYNDLIIAVECYVLVTAKRITFTNSELCVCVCVCARACACVCACMRVCVCMCVTSIATFLFLPYNRYNSKSQNRREKTWIKQIESLTLLAKPVPAMRQHPHPAPKQSQLFSSLSLFYIFNKTI